MRVDHSGRQSIYKEIYVIRFAIPVIASLFLSGCMTFTVEADLPKTADSITGSETVHKSLYGIEWSKQTVEKCANQQGLTRIRFHTNAVYLLASVASLGLYVPQNVTWWCGAQPVPDDPDDVYVPGSNE